MIRSVVAVATGYVAFIVLTYSVWAAFGHGSEEVPQENFLMLSLLFETPFAVAAGYLAALVAGSREVRHSAGLAMAMALTGLVGLIAGRDVYPIWVHLATLFVLAPSCYLGGRIRQWQGRYRPDGA